MFDRVNEKIRLITISPPIPAWNGSIPRARSSTNAAPMSPKTAPDAPTVCASGVTSSAPNDPASSDVKYSAAKRTDPSAGSSIWPSTQSRYMLKPMCSRPNGSSG